MSHVKGNLPTGGPLNFLNEAAQTNSRKNTVPIMLLVSAHKPKTPEELKELLNQKWIFFLLLSLVSLEWFIRKWNGFV